MSTPLRRKRANSVIWGVLALVMVGLGGYGVTNFSQTVSSIGQVGSRPIGVNDYARAMRQEMNALSAQIGEPVGFDRAQQMGVDRQVLGTLVTWAAMEDEADKMGLSTGDAAIRDRITSAPIFRGTDGAFSRDIYNMWLQQQGMTEVEFEQMLRDEGARTILQGAVLTGVVAPPPAADRLTSWQGERRAFAYAELIGSDLGQPVGAPTDAQVQAWYDGHKDSYMRPETRQITYVWLSPDDVKAHVQVDEAALKQAYEARKSEYIVPERRKVARLVFPTVADAQAAKARYDAKTASFEDLVRERGLTPKDVDLGEVGHDDLGPAGDAVFAMTGPGITGPLDSPLGPALFALQGVLPGETTTFDEARPELNDIVALDRARRMIAEQSAKIEDNLASGASLADVAKETQDMTSGKIAYNAEAEGGLTGYEAFRKAAQEVTADSFPTLIQLDDGGVFAIQLDGIDPPSLKPLDQVKDQVIADWTEDETHRQLLALAEEQLALVQNGTTLEKLGLVTTHLTDFARNGHVQDADPAVAQAVFAMTAGETKVVDAAGKVWLVTLESVTPADPASAAYKASRDQVAAQLSQSMGRDVMDLYTRALQAATTVTIDQAALNAANNQLK